MRSGATKEPYFYSSLGRAENEESCLPRGETRYTLQVYQYLDNEGVSDFLTHLVTLTKLNWRLFFLALTLSSHIQSTL